MAHEICEFKIGESYYGFAIEDVLEIIKTPKITPVPLSPDHIEGLVNLRGHIVTVLNTSQIINKTKEGTNSMSIIVKKHDSIYAFLIDDVPELVSYSEEDTQTIPHSNSFYHKVIKKEDRLITLLSVNHLLELQNL